MNKSEQNVDVALSTASTTPNDHSSVEKMNNEVFIQAGNYCVAFNDISIEHNNKTLLIPKNEVLLIRSLKLAHDIVHSVVVSTHPRHHEDTNYPSTHSFLFEDFCDKFKVISSADGLEVRKKEMQEIQNLANQKQQELFDIQSNPQKLAAIVMGIYSRRIEHKDNSFFNSSGEINAVSVIESGLTKDKIEQLRQSATQTQDLLKIQTDWMMEKQKEIQNIFSQILPYGSELAASQKASMQEINRDIETRQEGIKTLELYLGENIEVFTIKKGNSADSSIPLTMLQETLFADAELSLHRYDAVNFDFENRHILWDEFNNQSFVDQIFPTQRCVVLMRSNAVAKDYGHAYVNAKRNEDNMSVFLLVRDGENLYALFSPISSHLKAARLFPSKDQINQHLFKNNGKISINIDDLEYSDALSQMETEILHFKRFLILISGLDHREKLFGHFYPQDEAYNFFYPEFQDKYFNFIHDSDGEGMLPRMEESRPTVSEYLKAANSKIKVGSRVFVFTHGLINEDNCPACYSERNAEVRKKAHPVNDYEVVVVSKDAKGLFVKIPVINYRTDREFDATTYIQSNLLEKFSTLICLDGLIQEDLDFYIKSRVHRLNFFNYIELFKNVKDFVDFQYKGYEETIDYLQNAIQHIPDNQFKADFERNLVVRQTLNTFFAASNGCPHIDAQKNEELLYQLNLRASPSFRAKYIDLANNAVDMLSVSPLRLTVDSEGSMWLYTTLEQSELKNEFEPNVFARRCSFTVNKSGKVKIKLSKIVLIDQSENEEYIVHDWDEAEYFKESAKKRDLIFKSYYEKSNCIEALDMTPNYLKAFYSGKFSKEQAYMLYDAYHQSTETHVKKLSYREGEIYLPVLLLSGSLYSAMIKDAKALIAYLNSQFNLVEYAMKKYGDHYVADQADQADYHKGIIFSYCDLMDHKHKILGSSYKAKFNSIDYFTNALNYKWINSEIVRLDSRTTLAGNIYYLRDKQWSLKNKDIESYINGLPEKRYSAFPLHKLFDYQNLALDRLLGNPMVNDKTIIKKVAFSLNSIFNDKKELVSSVVTVVTEPLESKFGDDLMDSIKQKISQDYQDQRYTRKNIRRNRVFIFTLRELEDFTKSIFKDFDSAFFQEDMQIKSNLSTLGFTGELSKMDTIYDKDHVTVLQMQYPK